MNYSKNRILIKFLLLTFSIIIPKIAEGSAIPKIDSTLLYTSNHLSIYRLSDHVYAHLSYLQTNDFGRVPCNGMIVINKNEAAIFDTPANDSSTSELIQYLSSTLHVKIKAIVPTHFHEDCVAGIEKFIQKNIPVIAHDQTIDLLKTTGKSYSKPFVAFNKNHKIKLADKKVYLEYHGQGHTKDNVVAYFPVDEALFGGCLIKEMNASKGYLGDANLSAWPTTVKKLKAKHSKLRIVIPGHGDGGGIELLDYTISLFSE